MNNFEFKKYFKNLVGLEPISIKPTINKKPLLSKGISEARLQKRSPNEERQLLLYR